MPHDLPLVLLVDNHDDNREMYAEYLGAQGFRVIACADSEASLDLARTRCPDIILLELRMDRMSGFEVLASLKHKPPVLQIPVVALTASVMPCERAAAVAAGFTEVLAKPCYPDDLVRAITRMLSSAGTLPITMSEPDPSFGRAGLH